MRTTSQPKPVTQSELKEVARLFNLGVSNLLHAGRVLAALYLRDINIIQRLCDAYPTFSKDVAKRLLSVGQGTLHPQLVFLNCPASNKLMRMPLKVQTSVVKQGGIAIGTKGVVQLNKISGLDAKAYINVREARILQPSEVIPARLKRPAAPRPYTINGSQLVVHSSCRIRITTAFIAALEKAL